MSDFESDEPEPTTTGERWFHRIAMLLALGVFLLAPLGVWLARTFLGWEPPPLVLQALEYLQRTN